MHATEVVGYILCTNPTARKYWNIDSGASHHIGGKNKSVQIYGIGDIVGEHIRLYNVYLSNDLEEDELYISIGQLTGEGYTVLIDKGEVTIRLARNFNHIVGTSYMDRNA